MKTTLKLFIALALCFSAQAAVEVTALISLTSPSVTNLNGTNAASITIAGDTRIWTNAVTSAPTQMLATTNLANAVSRLLNHVKVGAYPFSGLTAYATNNGVKLVGSSAFTVTITNSWATVAYATNTIGGGYAVRAPRSTQPATEQAASDERVSDGLNNATTLVSGTATAMANFLPKTMALSSLAVDNAGTNFVANFTGDAYRTITATNSLNFLQSTNRAAARSIVLFLYPNGTNRSLTVPATWHALSAADAVITNTTVGVLSLTVNGTSETNVFYSYKAVP